MFLEGNEKIELGVLLYLYAQLIKSLDGSVAGKEVLRTGTEGDDLEVLYAYVSARDRNEIRDHLRDIIGCTYGIFGDIACEMTHSEVVRAVEHTAVSVASAVDHVSVAFCGSHEHTRTVKFLCDESFGGLGTEVSEEYHESVAALSVHVGDSLEHIRFVLHGNGTLIKVALVRSLYRRASFFG